MTAQEFSNEFDVLYNSITNGNAPGVTEYEKSVFLTRALLEFIQELIKGNTVYGLGVDDTTNVRLLLYPIYKKSGYEEFNTKLKESKVLHILNIEIIIDDKVLSTIPISYDEYSKIINNPFKSNKNRAYYIQNDEGVTIYYNKQKQVSPQGTFYYIEYPTPIITDDELADGTIDNNKAYQKQDCILPKSTHFEILKKAVQLALIANGVQS